MQHIGIRGALGGLEDYENDFEVGFVISHAEDIEEVGWKGIVKKIRDTVGDNPVYSKFLNICTVWTPAATDRTEVTLDIDVLDPGVAPAYVSPPHCRTTLLIVNCL